MKKIFDAFLRNVKISNSEKSLYVIKGGEFYQVDDFFPNPLNVSIDKIEKVKQSDILKQALNETEKEGSISLNYFEYRYIKELNLEGIFSAKGYKTILLDFDFFDHYYCVSKNEPLSNKLYKMFEKTEETFIQKVYSNVDFNIKYYIYSYTEDENYDKIIHWHNFEKKHKPNIKKANKDTDNYIVSSINDFDLIDVVTSIIDKNESFCFSIIDNKINNSFFNFVL
ncbi:hypothetical protein, partial [Peloplasma aerotolerans]